MAKPHFYVPFRSGCRLIRQSARDARCSDTSSQQPWCLELPLECIANLQRAACRRPALNLGSAFIRHRPSMFGVSRRIRVNFVRNRLPLLLTPSFEPGHKGVREQKKSKADTESSHRPKRRRVDIGRGHDGLGIHGRSTGRRQQKNIHFSRVSVRGNPIGQGLLSKTSAL